MDTNLILHCLFVQVHTKKRNRLEHKRLSKLVYVSYNRKMSNRFQKIRELGSKAKKSNPLILEEFNWESEWVDVNSDPVHTGAAADGDGNVLTWGQMDEAIGATEGLQGRGLKRAAATRSAAAVSHTYARKKRPRRANATQEVAQDIAELNDSDQEMMEVDAPGDQHGVSDSEYTMEDGEDSGGPPDGEQEFQLNEALLD